MALKKYAVWSATPTSYTAQSAQQDSKSPHIYLEFEDGSGNDGEAAINVKGLDADSRLVYWMNRDFSHPITDQLEDLESGLHQITSSNSSEVALDYLRTSPALVNIKQGQILDADGSGAKTTILTDLEPILTDAINQKATIYLFGQSYSDSDGKSGIHDIHMNQGSGGGFENAVYSDGGMIFSFPDGHWESVFIAFASQEIPTDDTTGDPTDTAVAFDTLLAAAANSTSTS